MAIEVSTDELTEAAFVADPHARKYLGTLRGTPDAFARLLEILNDPVTERRLTSVAPGEPALGGIIELLETDPAVGRAIGGGAGSLRFRQAVGVAVRLRMEQLGWLPAGSKGTVRRSRYFGRAERYRPTGESSAGARALAALDAVQEIGSEEERRSTGAELQHDLRATRRSAGRPY